MKETDLINGFENFLSGAIDLCQDYGKYTGEAQQGIRNSIINHLKGYLEGGLKTIQIFKERK